MGKFFFGSLKNGEKVYAYTIKNGFTEIVIINYGATVQSFKFKGKDIVLGYEDAISYQKEDGYLGSCVGRVANRIANAQFVLDGIEYHLDKNNGQNSLHGGFNGISAKMWTVENYTEDQIELSVFSPEGEGGFPANVEFTVRYYALENGLGIEYFAKADGKTPINMTNHAYFNVNQTNDLKNTKLTVHADYITPVDQTLIPTGEMLSVKDTPFDFNSPKEILKDIECKNEQLKIANGYDHNFVLKGNGFRKVATLEGETLKVHCFTDREGIQIYSGNFLNGAKGKGGVPYDFRAGVCLETQAFPNSVNEIKFPSCIIDKNNPYKSKTEYLVEEK